MLLLRPSLFLLCQFAIAFRPHSFLTSQSSRLSRTSIVTVLHSFRIHTFFDIFVPSLHLRGPVLDLRSRKLQRSHHQHLPPAEYLIKVIIKMHSHPLFPTALGLLASIIAPSVAQYNPNCHYFVLGSGALSESILSSALGWHPTTSIPSPGATRLKLPWSMRRLNLPLALRCRSNKTKRVTTGCRLFSSSTMEISLGCPKRTTAESITNLAVGTAASTIELVPSRLSNDDW